MYMFKGIMAAVLPAINPSGSKLSHGGQTKVTRTLGNVSPKDVDVQAKKIRGKIEQQEQEKLKVLRAQQPLLTKKDTIQYVLQLHVHEVL